MIIPDVGKRILNYAAVIGPSLMTSSIFKLKLYKNNPTLGPGTVIGDFLEADFAGYASIDMTAFLPVITGIDGSGRAVMQWPLQTWTMGTPGTTNNIYGAYLTAADPQNSNAEQVVAAVPAAGAPNPMTLAGSTITYQPTVSLGHQAGTIVVPNVGLDRLLYTAFVGDPLYADTEFALMLCKANTTLDAALDYVTVLAAEADFNGYARAALHGVTPTFTGIDGSDKYVITWPLQSFSKSAGATTNNIYYYAVVASWPVAGGHAVLWCEPMPSPPVPMSVTGEILEFAPVLRWGQW